MFSLKFGIDKTADNEDNINLLSRIHSLIKLQHSAAVHGFHRKDGVRYYGWKPHGEKIKKILELIKPMQPLGAKKCRIGSDGDGGYVMLEPKQGIAYSFGISNYAPWDSCMSKRGIHVFQYDGTVPAPPEENEYLHFHKYNISGSDKPKPGYKNIQTIIADLGHENQKDIILQMDIEGAEWEVFNNIDEKILNHFSQIIVEFHSVMNFHPDAIKYHTAALEKIYKTHQSIHYHINNNNILAVFPGFNIGNTIEVTYARRSDWKFEPDYTEYPTNLDFPCNKSRPDCYIGNLELLLSADTSENF